MKKRRDHIINKQTKSDPKPLKAGRGEKGRGRGEKGRGQRGRANGRGGGGRGGTAAQILTGPHCKPLVFLQKHRKHFLLYAS